MAEPLELARPAVRAGACLHADQTARQLGEEPQHLPAPQLLPHNNIPQLIDAVDLEHVLGEIQTDRANLHVDGLLMVIRSTTITLWHCDAASGRRPPHQDEGAPPAVPHAPTPC